MQLQTSSLCARCVNVRLTPSHDFAPGCFDTCHACHDHFIHSSIRLLYMSKRCLVCSLLCVFRRGGGGSQCLPRHGGRGGGGGWGRPHGRSNVRVRSISGVPHCLKCHHRVRESGRLWIHWNSVEFTPQNKQMPPLFATKLVFSSCFCKPSVPVINPPHQ